ncbi:hypothetical protein Aph02nite_77960 [Actinoplanes philippinensis]|uniref:DUF4240 domain-containing protein n=1 Tax=Actinoplanes philippinensis TaxID=35752 RepID=A0A1I2KC94_9ACTN|nr:DUF4240 domain-containing protein [Actinoplanes philippinensis]GIE81846.1 hypothetical protein Aph02nite_77960 [Actinoplanes philippinensis]SFF63919.1 Protein of unknown function [Actinoplanes philippinensis]
MDEDEFWAVVEDARSGVGDTRTGEGAEEVATRVGQRLAASGPDTAVAFDLRYDLLAARSYDGTLWAAAYLMKGGCSDDAFDYFRGWLVAQGRTVWERALENPDTLAELGIDPDDDFLEGEDMLSVGRAAFAGDEDFHAAVDAARRELPADTFAFTLTGDDFDYEDDDEIRARFPRLAAVYLD